MTAIRGWSIDGGPFFPGCTVSGLPDGLTVLHGANEAGKSTILEFVRRVLFGAPRALAAEGMSAPQRGCVVIDDAGVELAVERDVERSPPVVRRLDGGAVDAGELHRRLGGADERLFRTVFAFSLDDLQSLATLDAAGVHEALFSASLAGAGRSAAAAMRALRTEAAARVRGEGAAQASRLIAELNALRPRLNAARRAALAYGEQRAAADRLAAAVDAQRAAVAARRAAHRRDDALLRAWPAWVALQAARAELAALEPGADIPVETEAQLGAARERLGSAQGAVRALRAQRAEAEHGVAMLPAAGAAAALAAEVEMLHAELPLYRFQRAALPEAHARRADAVRLLAERVERLGGEWTVERVRTWGGAAAHRDRVRDWQARLRAAEQRESEGRGRLDGAAAAHAAARREHDRAAAELSASAASGADEIGRQTEALAELRRTIEEMLVRRSHGETCAQTRRERGHAIRALEVEHDPPLPAWLVGGPAVVAAASAAAAAWSIAYGGPLSGLAALALAGVAAAVAYWLASQRRARAQREAERQAARRRARAEMEAARRARDEAWHRAAALAGQIARQAEGLGLPPSPDGADLAARERALAADAAEAERATLLMRTRLAGLEIALQQRAEDERARADESAAAATARRAIEAEFAAWRSAAGFAAESTPEALLDQIDMLEAARASLVAHDEAVHGVQPGEAMVAGWEARARSLLARAGAADTVGFGGDALSDRVLALRQRAQDEVGQHARRTALVEELRARGAQLAEAEAEVDRGQAAVDTLLRSAGARDESDLVRRRTVVARRRALEQAVAEQERAIADRMGDEQDREELAQGAVDLWRQRAAVAYEDIAALEQRLYQLVAEHHHARAACGAVEASPEVASLELEWNGLTAELGEAVRDWRVLAAAEGLIDDARQSFERTRQPAVLQTASAAFAAVTGGRYDRIAQDELGTALLVIGRDGRRKRVGGELSRGTTEQLYLSIRLGLAREFARRGAALPLVMDDVLVNFDPARAAAMAEVLGTFARDQQVLFFTCHPATRDLLMEYGHAQRLVEL